MKCTKEVLDLTGLQTSNIPQVMASTPNPCIHILSRQIDEMNWLEWFNSISLSKQINHLFLFTFFFVFQLNGMAQESDTIKTLKTDQTLPKDSSQTDTTYCLPIITIDEIN